MEGEDQRIKGSKKQRVAARRSKRGEVF